MHYLMTTPVFVSLLVASMFMVEDVHASCSICGEEASLPEPDRFTADGVTCQALQDAAAASNCHVFQFQYEEECCSAPDIGQQNTAPPTPKSTYQECLICGASNLSPTNTNQTFTLSDPAGTFTCQELDVLGRNGTFHPGVCSFVRGLLNTPADICTCSASSSSSPPPTPQVIPTPPPPTTPPQEQCGTGCQSDGDCSCAGYACDWRGSTPTCTTFLSGGLKARSKIICRKDRGGVRRCKDSTRYLRGDHYESDEELF